MATGAALVMTGHVLPVYNVPFTAASEAYLNWCTPEAVIDDAVSARYMAMFGWHYALMNAGVLLTSAGLTAAALAVALRMGTDPGRAWLRSPAHRWTFIAIGIGVIMLTLFGIVVGLQTDLSRQYFPSCADSIGIPIAGLSTVTFVLVPLLTLAGLLVTLGFGALPVPLDQWDANRPRRSWAVTIVFGLAMAGGVAMLLSSAFSSDLIGPSTILTLYLLASTRAALLAPRRPKGQR